MLPIISSALVFGADCEHVAALIAVDREALATWAKERGVSVHVSPETLARIDEHITGINARLPANAAVRRYKVLAREFSIRDGEVTPWLIPNRSVIFKKYATSIAECFAK
jgi:long-chain acyl-CoA synthetase